MANVPALKHTLGNAPSTWHVVVGLPGYFHPDIPSPVGGPLEATVEEAKAASKDKGCPVSLVEITEDEAAKTRELIHQLRGLSRKAAREAVRAGEVNEQVHAETAAVSG